MSFRTRLILAAAAAVAVALTVGAVAAYLVVRSELHGEIDDSLRDRAAAMAGIGFGGPGGFPPIPPPVFGEAAGYVQAVSADGDVVRPPGADTPLPVGARVRRVAAGSADPFLSDAHVSGVHLRILATQARPGVAVQIARPLTEVDDVLRRLRLILFGAGAGGVALAAALGVAVARASLRPVRRLTETTEEITATRDLARRAEAAGGDELGRLAASFNAMLGALETSVGAQRRLVSDASHELRTPLASLRTNVELLARADLPAEERERALDDAQLQLEELTKLVTDVVELARDGEPTPLVEEVRLDHVVADAVERARRHAPGARFETDLEESVVRGVPDRLDRAVANLLANAAQWSPDGGLIEVTVREGEVVVRDHGPGFADHDLPFVFDRFYRADAARGRPGSGLGLAIVRQVAETHGGTATAETAADGGAILRLRVPSY